jgi:hypothetical protein
MDASFVPVAYAFAALLVVFVVAMLKSADLI